MKFGKRLKQQIEETLPEWRDNFLCYKELKKLVRLISSSEKFLNVGSMNYSNPETEFVFLLNTQIDKFNSFFMEKEEDFIIRHKELQQRIQRVEKVWGPQGSHPSEIHYKAEIVKIRKDIVNFHGEMVLLINYSNINYTGLAKILKKYDKRTGSLLRLPFIEKVLEQPFFTTDLISKLIKELEATIDAIMFPRGVANDHENQQVEERSSGKTINKENNNNYEIIVMGDGIFRNTVAALLTVEQITTGSGSSTTFTHNYLDI